MLLFFIIWTKKPLLILVFQIQIEFLLHLDNIEATW